MTWSADDEYRTRVLSRRRTVLQLRHPGAAYGPVALILMYAAGLIATLWGATGFAGAGSAIAGALTLPVGVATAVAALAVGGRLQRHEESSPAAVIVRIALVWAVFGAVWALGSSGPELLGSGGQGFGVIGAEAAEAGLVALAGALVGACGGVAGGAAATLLCVERRS